MLRELQDHLDARIPGTSVLPMSKLYLQLRDPGEGMGGADNYEVAWPWTLATWYIIDFPIAMKPEPCTQDRQWLATVQEWVRAAWLCLNN